MEIPVNIWRQFRSLLPSDPLRVGEVIAHNSDGTSSVMLPGNITLRARGQDVAIGQHAFVQGGQIQGQAPALMTYYVAI